MTREERCVRIAHLRNTAPGSDELKILEAEFAMTGPQVLAIINDCDAKKKPLYEQIRALDEQRQKARELCPHEKRYLYDADQVITNVCVYCGDQVHVRTYGPGAG